jgi:hypothetical protein
MKTWWDDKIQGVVFPFWSYCYVLFAWNSWCSPLDIKLSTVLAVKWISCFQNSSTEHYQYSGKAAVIKLSFWFRWPVMLLMCCRLQDLWIWWCVNMKASGLLHGIGSIHELTTLRLTGGCNLTAEELSTFFYRPSVASIVLLDLSSCTNLNDEGLKRIAERYNMLTYLHV